MTPIHRKRWLIRGAATVLVALGALGATHWAHADDPTEESRYPYDPVCSWGRIADGKGMLVRCLTRQESEQLLRPKPAAPAPTVVPMASSAAVGPLGAPPAVDSAAAVPAAEELVPVSVEVGPLVPDAGKLPLGEKKLREPKDRYLECVQKNGGLSEKTGEVVVRFLVRERGRAEGVSVSKRRSVSKAAARCVASVVDRRMVGVPDEPMVGASLTVTFSSQVK